MSGSLRHLSASLSPASHHIARGRVMGEALTCARIRTAIACMLALHLARYGTSISADLVLGGRQARPHWAMIGLQACYPFVLACATPWP